MMIVDHINQSYRDFYLYGSKRSNNILEELIKIKELVKVRSIAKNKKDYDIASRFFWKYYAFLLCTNSLFISLVYVLQSLNLIIHINCFFEFELI